MNYRLVIVLSIILLSFHLGDYSAAKENIGEDLISLKCENVHFREIKIIPIDNLSEWVVHSVVVETKKIPFRILSNHAESFSIVEFDRLLECDTIALSIKTFGSSSFYSWQYFGYDIKTEDWKKLVVVQ
ncbi:hypothetical protein K8I28_14435 [bacterium]|nr:hypothetical protein [bacterium]